MEHHDLHCTIRFKSTMKPSPNKIHIDSLEDLEQHLKKFVSLGSFTAIKEHLVHVNEVALFIETKRTVNLDKCETSNLSKFEFTRGATLKMTSFQCDMSTRVYFGSCWRLDLNVFVDATFGHLKSETF